MNRKFTQEDILLYLYGEMPQHLHPTFEKALAQNPDLKEQFIEMQSTMHVMDHVKYSPSPTSINIILEQSHDSALEIQ